MRTKLIGFFIFNGIHKRPYYNIMPYDNTGTVHHTGVGNEKQLIEYANAHPDLRMNQHFQMRSDQVIPPVWSHLGGTTQKADCVATVQDDNYLISVKNHESTGTFDWINTSKLHDINAVLGESLKSQVAEFKAKYNGQEVTKEIRQEMENVFDGAFQLLSSDEIKTMLQGLYEKYPEYVLVNDRSQSRLVMYHKLNNFKEFTHYEDWDYVLRSTRGKTSRMLFREKDGVSINTNLRIRLVLNNGVNALIGQSSKNKSSVPCLKIQQDRVNLLLTQLEDSIIDTLPEPPVETECEPNIT